MTKFELRQYIALEREMKQIDEAITRLRTKLEKPLSPAVSPLPKSQPPLDPTGDMLAKMVDLENLYAEKWDQLIDLQYRIEVAIGQVDDSTERQILRYRYLEGLDWIEICVRMSYSWKQTHRIHNRALIKIAG